MGVGTMTSPCYILSQGTFLGFIWCGELDKPEVENEEESRLRNVNDEESRRRRNSTGNVEEEGDYTTVDNRKAKGKKKRKVRTAQFSSSPEELARVKHMEKMTSWSKKMNHEERRRKNQRTRKIKEPPRTRLTCPETVKIQPCQKIKFIM